MGVVQGLCVIPTRTHLPVVSVCATQAAAVVAQRGKLAMQTSIRIPVVSAAAIQRVAAAATQGLSATVTLLHRVVDFVRHRSAEVAHLGSCVTRQLVYVFAITPVAAVAQRVQPVIPTLTLKLVVNAYATPAAAVIVQRVRCAMLIQTPIAAAFAEWTQPAVLKAIAIKIAVPVRMNPFAPV